MLTLLVNGILELLSQIRDCFEYGWVALGIVLEIAEHLGEIRGPDL